MLVRMSRWQTRPDRDDDSRRIWADGARGVFLGQPGIVQASILALPDTDSRMTFSVWQSQADHDRFAAGALKRTVSMFDDIFVPGTAPEPVLWSVLTDDWGRG